MQPMRFCAPVHPSLCLRFYCALLQLSAVPNTHFYGGRLVDGCSAAQRPALLPGCPPLALLDVRCSITVMPSPDRLC